MTRGIVSELGYDEIVSAALELFEERGLDAVSMRSLAARLGVSPIPLYSRVGNKEALLDAMADQVLAGVAPVREDGEPWQAYTARWARALRDRLVTTRDIGRLLGTRRTPYLAAAESLVDALTSAGFTRATAGEACQLVMWATIGFSIVEPGSVTPSSRRQSNLAELELRSMEQRDADRLFELHIRYLVSGLEEDVESSRTA
ncbi:TetR family transcriptional regulator [Frankia sp. CNm7]|uniref:TetR family transcriptional regulator n=1 Tax=Frankia nepalensis TaxID=1836974 RepID=A0A937RMT9_9ACTN|nr:TetR family transcriptional regulator [Frankia nepalensis]MBL7498472.1 TetR family transcriptional regulator [Frankia nepalensis]MBL7509493.1 TetR family transcriptional regulator [Frankia nepalensis]MBL7520752.1 TetR family transcriptional regulator [Frankia nepalensis]MBL7629303.1 TetR family transcriptional regulator [Frankia nepalensis]